MIKTYKKLIATVLFITTGASNIIAVAPQGLTASQPGPMTYKEIGDKHISSFGIVETKKEELTDKEEKKRQKKRFIAISQLSQYEKEKEVFEIFETGTLPPIKDMSPAIHQGTRTAINEIQAFYGSDENPSNNLFSKIDYTKTALGQAVLAKTFTQPIGSTKLLQKRQDFIRELVNNKQLFDTVNDTLEQFAAKESDLLSLWQSDSPIDKKMMKNFYININIPVLKSYNKSQAGLATWRTLKKALPTYMNATSFFGTFYSMKCLYHTLQLAYQNNPDTVEKKNILKNIPLSQMKGSIPYFFGWLPSFLTKPLDARAASIDSYDKNTIDDIYKAGQKNTKLLVGMSLALGALQLGMGTYKTWKFISQLKQDHMVLKYMYTRLTGLRALLDAAEQLHNLACNDSIVSDGLFLHNYAVNDLENKAQESSDLKTLITLLNTKTFNGNYSFFSRTGRILAAFEIVKTTKDAFSGTMQAIGELDACLSIAKLYKQFQNNSNATYCFVEYLDQDKPYLQLTDFWNPMIDPAQVVTNNIELGNSTGARAAIITGSNTGGKSTILKAVVINILLSRFGIAPARKAIMTPFSYLATSLNISDNTAAGISLFKAEVLRAKTILNNIKSLRKDQHAFLAIDELFVGTNAQNGSAAAHKVASHISTFDNTLFTLATHFPQLTDLEEETNGICKNYKVDIFKNEDGSLTRPFKLEAGISTSNVADVILQDDMGDIDFLQPAVS